jgi:hypothetical protein
MSDVIDQSVLNKVHIDKFLLILDTPKVLKNYQSNSARSQTLLNLDKMQFSVIGVNIPSHKIAAVGVPFRGQTPHVTSQTRDEYPPASVKFTIDNNFDNYWFIWKWMKLMNDPKDSGMDSYFAEFTHIGDRRLDPLREINNPKPITYKHIKMLHDYTDYQTIINLIALREYNEKIVQFTYSNAFPVSLGEINYDYRESGEISCSFDFAYGQVDVELIEPR